MNNSWTHLDRQDVLRAISAAARVAAVLSAVEASIRALPEDVDVCARGPVVRLPDDVAYGLGRFLDQAGAEIGVLRSIVARSRPE